MIVSKVDDRVAVVFRVSGTPVPQGSLRAHMAGGTPVLHYSNREPLAVWRDQVRAACLLELGLSEPTAGPFAISIGFRFRRPAGHYSAATGRVLPRYADARPDRRPDLDKLVRAVLDALTGVVWRDDGQVVHICARKVYETEPGAVIEVWRA
jgi:crossover junction endodeoxyribonuclease RusA